MAPPAVPGKPATERWPVGVLLSVLRRVRRGPHLRAHAPVDGVAGREDLGDRIEDTSSAAPARRCAYSHVSGRACASSRRRAPASAPWHSRESHGTLETAREGSAGIRAAVRASREEGLQLAIQAIAKDPKDVKTALATKKSANEIRRFYEIELGRLFRGEPTMEVVKSRALLRRLDVVGLRLNEAADRLSDAAIKRWA